MSEENLASLRRGYEAFNRGDPSVLVGVARDIATPDIEWGATGTFPGVASGNVPGATFFRERAPAHRPTAPRKNAVARYCVGDVGGERRAHTLEGTLRGSRKRWLPPGIPGYI